MFRKLIQRFAVNIPDNEFMPRPRWIQWGSRRNIDSYSEDKYRYFLIRLPVWWTFEDRYGNELYGVKPRVLQDGTVIWPRVRSQLMLIWREKHYPREWLFHWEGPPGGY
jgi:hypothetical protein